MTFSTDFIARFWAKVDMSAGPEGCWPWTGCTSEKRGGGRYGVIRAPMKEGLGGQRLGAHRVALALGTDGRIHALDCCHRCDNPICCNPRHLFWATHAENMQDYARKYGGVARPKWMREAQGLNLLDLLEASA